MLIYLYFQAIVRKIGQSTHPSPAPPPPPVPAHPIFHPQYAPHHHYEEPYKPAYQPASYHPEPYKPQYYEPKSDYYEPKQDYYEPKPIAYSHSPPFPQYNSYYDDEAFNNFPSGADAESLPQLPLYSSYEQTNPRDDYDGSYNDFNRAAAGYYEKRSASGNDAKIAKINNRQTAAKPITDTQSNLLNTMLHHQRHLQLQQLHNDKNNALFPA